jgi:uncharacterized membrane protein YdjX (TVP38/TMEM64 family)
MRGVAIVAMSLLLSACAKVPTAQEANSAMLVLREYESWGWAIGIGLIWADVLLPIPQTSVIAALGILYGPVTGALVGSVGLISGGCLAYGLTFTAARRFLPRLLRPQSRHELERLFDEGGAWAIVLTRSLPYSVPEAMTFLAGLARMPVPKFLAALTIGSVPTAIIFAAIGAGWAHQPIVAVTVSYALPIVLLPVALYVVRRRAR